MKQQAKPTVIITGATGYVGAKLTAHFAAKGWSVVGLVRTIPAQPPAGVTYVSYDLAQPLDDTVFKGAVYLVHTAYVKHDPQHPDAYDVNVEAARQLVDASRKHGLRHTVFMSTMSAHEGGTSVYAKQKLAIEAFFTGPRDTVLRSGLIIGNGGIVQQMAAFMRSKHVVPLVGGGTQPLQIVAVYDLVRVIDRVLTKGIGGHFTLANPRVYQYKEFYVQLGRAIKAQIFFVPVPYAVILGVMRLAALLHIPLSAGEENLQGLKALIAVDTTSDLQKLGVQLDDLEMALKNVRSSI